MGKRLEVIIIGAGIGGITAGIFLSRKGYNVTIFEKNSAPGGRCGNFVKNGHRFDIGATLLMMPDVFEKTYAAFGKSFMEELKLYRMDPVYKIKFHNGEELFFSSDLARLRKQFETLEPGSYDKFLKLTYRGYRAYKESLKHLIEHNFYSIFDYSVIRNILLLIKSKAYINHYKYISKHFKNELLRAILTFQNMYLGQNPFKASAIFTLIPSMELTEGVYFPEGGMQKITESLSSIAQENNVKFSLNSPVKVIKVNNNKSEGIILEDDSFHRADIIISNADLPYSYNNLLSGNRKESRYNKLSYTCSAFVFHWAIDTVYSQLEQHTVFVPESFKETFHSIFTDKSLPEEPIFYIHSPVKSDISAAPENQDSITAIVPAGHIDSSKEQKWATLKSKARKAIFKRLSKEGINDFEKHIKSEVCYTPQTWKNLFNLSAGATFGSLNHNIMQMGYFRPHNRHKVYKNLYFTGGCTHPGNGVPLALMSGKLTAERIFKEFKQ
jgi:phytoene desaturase